MVMIFSDALQDIMSKEEEEGLRKNESIRKKKRKGEKGNKADASKAIQISDDQLIEVEGEKKRNKPKKNRKSKDKNDAFVGKFGQLGSDAIDGFTTKLLKKEEEGGRKNEPIRKMKRKREKGNNADASKAIQISEDQLIEVEREKKGNIPKKKRKSKHKVIAVVGKFDQLGSDAKDGFNEQKGIAEKGVTRRERQNIPEKMEEADHDNVYYVSSGDDDCSKGMKKWLAEYRQSRPGLKVLQQRIDEFITAHEEKLEQERKEREALAAEGGWTVVKHHKGRKKTTDSESGITVGSVAPAVVEDNLAKKKSKEVGVNFYRFQKRENQRNEILMLQSKFEQDKQRIQQLRAARKFRPY